MAVSLPPLTIAQLEAKSTKNKSLAIGNSHKVLVHTDLRMFLGELGEEATFVKAIRFDELFDLGGSLPLGIGLPKKVGGVLKL